MLNQMQDELGPYMNGNDTSLHGDEIKTGSRWTSFASKSRNS